MSYQVDRIVMNGWWDTYATCPHKEYADTIAQGLLARGDTVRVSKVLGGIELGPVQIPEPVIEQDSQNGRDQRPGDQNA